MKRKKFYFLVILMIIITCFCNYSIYATSVTSSSSDLLPVPDTNIASDTLGLSAPAGVLIDEDTGKVLYDKNAYTKMYPASTTKTMTAVLTMEKCSLDSMVSVSYYAVHSVPTTYSIANLQPEESISVKNLLYSLMVASANDAAFVLAQYIANGCSNSYPLDSTASSKTAFTDSIAKFSDMMNSKATEIGCKNTHFVNPNGIHNNNHYSTAYDLALICKCARTFSFLNTVVQTYQYSLPSSNAYNGETRNFTTTNLLLHKDRKGYYQYATGFKTGYTDDAKYCLIASATKNNVNLIAVVLHSESVTDFATSRETDAKKMFEYGFNNYSYKSLIDENSAVTSVNVFNATSETKSLNLIAQKQLKALIKNGETTELSPNISVNKLIAPIAKGSVVGKVTYTIDGVEYSTDLIAEHDVYAANYLSIIWILLIGFAVLLFFVTFIELRKKKKKSKKHRSKHSKLMNY